jgi:DNA gyrase/topoisomerase IV subunit B
MPIHEFILMLSKPIELSDDQVEPRREFIQKHALDVRNLDV